MVKWISRGPPKAELQVRFLPRGPNYPVFARVTEDAPLSGGQSGGQRNFARVSIASYLPPHVSLTSDPSSRMWAAHAGPGASFHDVTAPPLDSIRRARGLQPLSRSHYQSGINNVNHIMFALACAPALLYEAISGGTGGTGGNACKSSNCGILHRGTLVGQGGPHEYQGLQRGHRRLKRSFHARFDSESSLGGRLSSRLNRFLHIKESPPKGRDSCTQPIIPGVERQLKRKRNLNCRYPRKAASRLP